jgi:hypothetical protein
VKRTVGKKQRRCETSATWGRCVTHLSRPPGFILVTVVVFGLKCHLTHGAWVHANRDERLVVRAAKLVDCIVQLRVR